MSVVDMCHVPSWISGGSLAADYTSSAVDCSFYTEVNIQLKITETTTPAGSVIIQGSSDNTTWDDLYIDANRVHGTIDGSDAAHAGGEEIAIAGSAASDFMVSLVDGIPRYVRVFYDRTSGGAVNTFNGTLTMRG